MDTINVAQNKNARRSCINQSSYELLRKMKFCCIAVILTIGTHYASTTLYYNMCARTLFGIGSPPCKFLLYVMTQTSEHYVKVWTVISFTAAACLIEGINAFSKLLKESVARLN